MNTRIVVAALAFVCIAPLAHAQIVIQVPQLPGARVEPDRRDPRAEQQREAYWRQRHENERDAEWRRQEEFREEHQRAEPWQRDHCVRDFQNQVYCRR